jgi:NADP-dependent 3-hydroxy acid dehydrogenase YdfG
MKNIIVITGASSGFGALTARALAKAGHTVYASMRETKGRNAPQVKELQNYAAEHSVDLRPIELNVMSRRRSPVTAPSRKSSPRTVASMW